MSATKAKAVLQKILPTLRNDDQGGYNDCKNGKFSDRCDYVLRVEAAELDALFEFAGIVPDSIQVNGHCDACIYGSGNEHGRDQGWAAPCSSCKRPKMSNFVSLAAVKESALKLTDEEAQFLVNARDREWWATGIVTAPIVDDTKAMRRAAAKREAQMAHCHRIQARMLKRELIIGQHDRRMTNKGLRALALWSKKKTKRQTVVVSP